MTGSRKILLIEDDKDDQFLFEEALREIDSSLLLITADDGLSACQWLDSGRAPEIIFLDLNMPKMNGFEFLKWFSSTKYSQNIPVIVFTTSSSPEDREKALSLGASDFITKPANQLKVVKLIERCLSADWHSHAAQ